jgi:hypothetical protein
VPDPRLLRVVGWSSLLVGAILAALVVRSTSAPLVWVVVAAGIMTVGTFVEEPVSSGNRLTLAVAVAAAVPFVFVTDSGVDLQAVGAVYLVGFVGIGAAGPLYGTRLDRSVGYAARQFAGYSIFAFVFATVRSVLGDSLGTSTGWEILIPFAAAGLAWFATEVGLWSVFSAPYRGVPSRYLARAATTDANVFASLVATGALFGLMFEALGWWALPVALLPYSFAHGAFRRFQETKITYKQTIRALARIPEVAGLNLDGHADRTTELAVAMAKDLGLEPGTVDDAEFAAIMHDIGRITLNEPTVAGQGWTDDDLARWGSEIIGGAPTLDRIAVYVRHQYDAYRKPGEESDPSVSAVSRIVKVASAYDAAAAGEGLTPLEALERLHQGAAYDYDPEVVASLRRIILRRESAVSV